MTVEGVLMSFQQLFEEARRYGQSSADVDQRGLPDLSQCDTSAFDLSSLSKTTRRGGARGTGCTAVCEHDIDTLHNAINYVYDQTPMHMEGSSRMFTTKQQQRKGVLRSACIAESSADRSCVAAVDRALPDLVWENEVLSAMNDEVWKVGLHRYYDGATAPGSSDQTRLFQRIDFNPAFAQCFDTDYIDLERSDDPLDALIPNVNTDYEYAADRTQDATSGMDWTSTIIGNPLAMSVKHQSVEGNHPSDITIQPIDQSIIRKREPVKSTVAKRGRQTKSFSSCPAV